MVVFLKMGLDALFCYLRASRTSNNTSHTYIKKTKTQNHIYTIQNKFSVFCHGLNGGGGVGIHYSLKALPIIHLIKMCTYLLKSIPLFINKFDIFKSDIIKSYIPHCLFPTLVPRLRPLGSYLYSLANQFSE